MERVINLGITQITLKALPTDKGMDVQVITEFHKFTISTKKRTAIKALDEVQTVFIKG